MPRGQAWMFETGTAAGGAGVWLGGREATTHPVCGKTLKASNSKPNTAYRTEKNEHYLPHIQKWTKKSIYNENVACACNNKSNLNNKIEKWKKFCVYQKFLTTINWQVFFFKRRFMKELKKQNFLTLHGNM
uniref:Uncharacterized protein n=1 Tax=Romanomermis culicivorax TaxID=13658 RepID=A0A915KEB0_ROMCU